jgi:Skp family chaperone for outer membrane proteins
MDKLEKFITENAEHFNDSEPEVGHFERFKEKLGRETGKSTFRFRRSMMLKVAAVILVLVTATVLVFDFAADRISKTINAQDAAGTMSREMEDAMNYYDGQTLTRLGEFNRLACCGDEQVRLNEIAARELNNLDVNIEELKQALQADPQNERIQAALIRNQQMKGEVLDNMIRQMKKMKGGN